MPDSYRAELAAAIFGLKVGRDICKLALISQDFAPGITIKYDALTVGNQLSGQWACHQAPLEARILRSFALLTELRFGSHVFGVHVRGHCGEPGNELVDALANQASKGHGLDDFQPFFDYVYNPVFADAADWFWMLFRQDLHWKQNAVVFPSSPETKPVAACLPQCPVVTPELQTFNVKMRCASLNVLTLKGFTPDEDLTNIGLQGPTRSSIMLKQMMQAEVSIFALQETRISKHKPCHSKDYWLFNSPATSRGHFGIIVGFARRIPVATGPDGPIYFLESDFSIIAAEPRCLILRVKSSAVKAILIAAHAPHTGACFEDIETFWHGLSGRIPQRYSDWPRLLLADANARIGNATSSHIGSFQAEADTAKSEPFRSFLAEEELWLPATFEEFQDGPGLTWKGLSRNDFIGISQLWDFNHCRTWVDASIDAGLVTEDHSAALLDLEFPTSFPISPNSARQKHLFDEEAVIERCGGSHSVFSDFLCRLPSVDWRVDVHTHAHDLTQVIAGKIETTPKKRPIRKVMSEDTWELVQSKREVRAQLAGYKDLQKRLVLSTCLLAWKSGTGVDLASAHSLQKTLDINIATALWEFRRLGRLVTSAICRDDGNFFGQLAQEGADVYEQQSSKRFWAVIRRSLPKFRQRRLNTAPMKIEGLEQQWEEYFQDLEVGHAASTTELVQDCHDHQTQSATACEIKLDDLPTLFEIEREFRATTAFRSTGFDPLPSGLFRSCAAGMARAHFDVILKQFLWQSEPVQNKGGPLVVIPKKPMASEVSQFRGIMLLPTLGKRVHALLRKRIMHFLCPLRPCGQLGGFAHQQVGFGSQPLRIFGRLMDGKGYSSGVLFVDLANAFHRLVRELVTGLVIPDDAAAVIANLHHHGHDTAGLCRWMELPGLLSRLHAPHHLVKLLQDIHSYTWYQLEVSDGPTITKRGTRPGSPLADCIFHVLMLDIVIEIHQQEPYQNLLNELDIQIDTIVWSDDLAIPWCTREAGDIMPALMNLLRKVNTCFVRRGFQLNLAKQKTSAVVSFRGSGAKELRERYYLHAHGGEPCRFVDAAESLLHVVPRYKHLGTYFAEKHDLDAEIGVRIGTAWSAFQSISKAILANRRLSLQVRSRLFQALILTKLFYGSGAWHTPTLAQCRRLRSVLWRMCQRIIGRRDLHPGLVMEEMFVKLRVLDPRIYIAQERLRFAQAMFSEGPAFAQGLLFQERQHAPDSWLDGLAADLEWMRDVGAFPEHPGITDIEAAIQLWRSKGFGGKAQWKAMLRTTIRRHFQQEATIQEAQGLQRAILRALSEHGATFTPDPREQATRETTFQCFCGQSFSTGQGLASHKRLRHGVRSLESDLLDGATCPCCLKYCWTTQRLQQHLAYISRRTGVNACYNWLRARGYQAGHDVVTNLFPGELRGVQRLDALPTFGPGLHLQTKEEMRMAVLQEELQDKLLSLGSSVIPPEFRALMFERFDSCIQQWFNDFVQEGYSTAGMAPLGNRFLECFEEEDQKLQWSEQAYIEWLDERCSSHVDAFEDGEAEWIVEEEVAKLLIDLPRHSLMTRIQFLQQSIAAISLGVTEQGDRGHRPVRRGVANKRERLRTLHAIQVAYEDQPKWQKALEEASWRTLPTQGRLPTLRSLTPRPHFLVAHLFSGRRRVGDVHYHMNNWARSHNVTVTILSVDTAVSGYYGNLCIESCSWRRVLELFASGWVSGGIAGSPCETSSAARNQKPSPGPDGKTPRWPRPLRTAGRPFGLAGLTGREYRQLKQGTAFFLQTLLLAVWQLIHGGVFLSEHPGPPPQQDFASIWRTGIVKLLLRHPEVALHVIQQWRWGAEAQKPTGILAIGIPGFSKEMYLHCDPKATRPTGGAIGKTATGEFKTSRLKEYPSCFSKGLVHALGSRMLFQFASRQTLQHDIPEELLQWVREASDDAQRLSTSTFLPDYQGR